MKPSKNPCCITIHRNFEKDESGKRAMTAYVMAGDEITKLDEADFVKFIGKLQAGSVLRLTGVHATDPVLLGLHGAGVKMLYTHWHQAGVDKGSPPEAIVRAWAALPSYIFREFKPRPDIADLRHILSLRAALMHCYGDALRAVKQEGRHMGLLTDEDLAAEPDFAATMKNLKTIRKSIVSEDGCQLDTKIGKLAAKIPECKLVQGVMCMKEWISASMFVAYSGGIERFATVSAWWKFCGQSVDEGHAPKRKRGTPSNWSPAMRTAVYLAGSSIIKNRDNPWREFYDKALAEELAAHDVKHPKCPTKQGHCGARARRKMMKEILKRIWLAVNGRTVVEDHRSIETQKPNVNHDALPPANESAGEAMTGL